MTLLAEYAVTPAVFDPTCYSSEEVCGLQLQTLKEVFLNEGLVRDLRDGEWANCFRPDGHTCHPRGKELLKKLVTQRRLVKSPPELVQPPADDAGWCDEALASHRTRALAGVIASDATGAQHVNSPIVSPISKLTSAAWWTSRSPSVQLGRTLAQYSAALDLVLRHANSLLLIDPYIDPTNHHQYSDLLRLLDTLTTRTIKPLVEIHRASWYGGGNDRRPRVQEVVNALQPGLSACATRIGISFEVFLWDEIHDRFLISDLIGISLPYGFGTTTWPGADTIWTRLGRGERDGLQRKYDPAYRAPRHRFTVQ